MTRNPKRGTDPRKAQGAIAGPGGPHDRNAVVIDATDAVLLDNATVALVEPFKDGHPIAGKPWWVLNLGGRIKQNHRTFRNLIGLASRQGIEVHKDFMDRLNYRLAELDEWGHM